MIKGRAYITVSEVRTSKKGNDYGVVELQAMGLSAIELFATETMVKELVVGNQYDFIFKMKDKELNGIASFKLVK